VPRDETFEELTKDHLDGLYSLAMRFVRDAAEAEDVVQETLLRAWRGIGGFRRDSSFSTWLHRIAVNEAHRSLHKGTRRVRAIPLARDELDVSAPEGQGPAQAAEYRELRAALKRTLVALPPPYRTAVILRDIEGLSTREAAEIAGVGEAAFKSRLHQARLKIRSVLVD
jgi:RNA polymerase sigma-70 factor, ECF subfamily